MYESVPAQFIAEVMRRNENAGLLEVLQSERAQLESFNEDLCTRVFDAQFIAEVMRRDENAGLLEVLQLE